LQRKTAAEKCLVEKGRALHAAEERDFFAMVRLQPALRALWRAAAGTNHPFRGLSTEGRSSELLQ
jgi:hypothetical protein